MSLETYTGFIKDIVDTNPQQTDPVAQGDDHLRGIKLTLSSQFAGLTDGIAITASESQINKTAGTFPEVVIGDNATADNNFFMSAEANDGTMSITRGNAGAPISVPLKINADNSIDGNIGVGANQTWQDVTGSRALGVTYTNNTGKPIMVNVQAGSNVANASGVITVGGVVMTGQAQNLAGVALVMPSVVVPDGATYAASLSAGTSTGIKWVELR